VTDCGTSDSLVFERLSIRILVRAWSKMTAFPMVLLNVQTNDRIIPQLGYGRFFSVYYSLSTHHPTPYGLHFRKCPNSRVPLT
jgi:hypothetical protein